MFICLRRRLYHASGTHVHAAAPYDRHRSAYVRVFVCIVCITYVWHYVKATLRVL